MAKTLRSL